MKKNRYKILVLSDLKSTTETTLKSTVGLAKMVDGEIHLFHVKRPTDVVKRENQLSAIRTINQDHISTEKKIKNIVDSISVTYGMNIKYSFTFGNVKNEIENHLKNLNPDIIVLGKRKPKSIKFLGDSITHFVLEKHAGPIMIAADNNAIEPNTVLSLGLMNGSEESMNIEFANDLMPHVQKPLKSFKVVKSSGVSSDNKELPKNSGTLEYVFEHRDDIIQNLSNYLSKSNINLLCIDRNSRKEKSKTNLIMTDLKEAMNKFNVSLLLTGGRKLMAE